MYTKSTLAYLLFMLLLITQVWAQQTFNRTLVHDGLTREYTVYVPASYTGASTVPLMFNFHGYSMTAMEQMNSADMRPIADTAGFILVYPQGSLDSDGFTFWNVQGPSTEELVDDIGFTSAMIDTLANEYMIDLTRVYVCGYSNGGFLTFDLACRLNNRITAVGTVASTMMFDSYNECMPTHPTAVVTIHGTNDFSVPYDGYSPYLKPLTEVSSYWVTYNNTETNASITQLPNVSSSDGSTVEHYAWGNGDGCTSVEHYKVLNGGHDWPGSYGNMDIDASSVIWNFVSQYDMNGLIGCSATSIEEDIQEEIHIYPNPVTHFVSVDMELKGTVSYSIYSTIGTLVMQGNINIQNPHIDVSHLSPNIYLLKLKHGNVRFIKR